MRRIRKLPSNSLQTKDKVRNFQKKILVNETESTDQFCKAHSLWTGFMDPVVYRSRTARTQGDEGPVVYFQLLVPSGKCSRASDDEEGGDDKLAMASIKGNGFDESPRGRSTWQSW